MAHLKLITTTPNNRAWSGLLLSVVLFAACAAPAPRPVATQPPPPAPNLDAETVALMAQAERVVFVVPFSHWDTDWHEAFPAYVRRSDGNILAAIEMAQADPRYRYTLEQVLFVQHFWDTYPEHRAALTGAVHARQLTFAWAGLVQPETSLAGPAIQFRNWQMGRDWITDTFGADYVPRSAWQSDAFGNSAALPQFLGQMDVPHLFIGRSQFRCAPDDANCEPLPHAFYWRSPASPDVPPVLTANLSYPTAWDAIHRLATEDEQVTALRGVVEAELARTTSKYLFVPMGSDFIDPLPNLPELVTRWNLADTSVVLVMADPDTAFQYLATQPLPTRTVDLNPLWQGFYASRPFAKIADKESEFFLTAGDKFGLLVDAPQSSAWYTAAMSAHYDNIGAVSFDRIWESTQRPRFEQTLSTAASDLAATLARVASAVAAPVVVFNPTSWQRAGVVEITSPGSLPDLSALPAEVQRLGPDGLAFRVEAVPSVGYAAVDPALAPSKYPAVAQSAGSQVTLSNGLVAVTLDGDRGGTFRSLALVDGPNLVSAGADEVVYYDDTGDIYGARFGEIRARQSQAPATLSVLAAGPLIARAQVTFILAGQPITQTITLRADDPLVEVMLELRALPDSSAILQIATTLRPETRTDDLGFMAFAHPVDAAPIAAGDVTYRRKIFYPFMYWSDVSDAGNGLTLITHGLQGLGGMDTLNLLLVRQVTDEDGEGVTDQADHRLRYAYWPHTGRAFDAQPWQAAYAFNQPLIPTWRSADQIRVQVPFVGDPFVLPQTRVPAALPPAHSMIDADGGLIADLYRRAGTVEAVVFSYDPAASVRLEAGGRETLLEGLTPRSLPVALELP